MIRAALYLSIVGMVSVDAANAETPKEAYEGCLSAGTAKFTDLCEPADLVARAIVFECNPQLLTMMLSLPPFKTFDKVDVAEKLRRQKAEEIMTHLLEYRLQHPCR